MQDIKIISNSINQQSLVDLAKKLREQRLAQLTPEQRQEYELADMLTKTMTSHQDPATSGD
ncbi:MAG: hypothetical protein HY094_06565 [Candidatus Melainabacteria bacterium]|nr:hypothetical protein [Candidatus Melainabacteria bacterium]